ncbi:MAG: UDP-3-O-(3-hydroxymyristoyl)glucosamine N-acyltransferase [Gemmatimonadota bacterium]|nr:UDP-3-O-(3-hydroxymyristoyl)glucosamine N-acyltransferase [Gemmatimonadota bacterium]
MALTAREIARLVGGELHGDPESVVDGVAALDRAGPRHATFLASQRYAAMLPATKASVVLVARDVVHANRAPCTVILVDRPHEAVQAILPLLYDVAPAAAWVAPTARIGRGVILGAGVRIEDYVVLGDNVRVGERTRLLPHVTVYADSEIGAGCIIHSGARIGSDGFGYVFRNSRHEKIPHVGRCVIGDDVEIGANTTVDRGSIDDTVIGPGTRIDNLVQIGHNVRVGSACLLMAQVGIAGSARIGNGVIIAGQAGVGGHVHIGDGARIGGQSGVFGDVPAGEEWSGYPARPHRDSLRATAALFKLSRIVGKLESLLRNAESARSRAGEV